MKDRFFSRFVTQIDTPGGHMLICLFVICLGATFTALRLPKGEDLIVAGAATLFQAMRGRGAENHLPGPGKSSLTVEQTEIEKPKE